MQTQGNLFTRGDTMLGVCEGLGEDLGIHPNFLRLAFAGILFVSPMTALAAYLGLGILVLASRLLFPRKATTQGTDNVATLPVREPSPAVEFKQAA